VWEEVFVEGGVCVWRCVWREVYVEGGGWVSGVWVSGVWVGGVWVSGVWVVCGWCVGVVPGVSVQTTSRNCEMITEYTFSIMCTLPYTTGSAFPVSAAAFLRLA
jgi:hypothetical protein